MMDPCSQVRSIVRDGSWSTWQIAKRGERETKLCASVCVCQGPVTIGPERSG
jgi:hypothetical protein